MMHRISRMIKEQNMSRISLGTFNEICSDNPPDYYKGRVKYWRPTITGIKRSNMTPEKLQMALTDLSREAQNHE